MSRGKANGGGYQSLIGWVLGALALPALLIFGLRGLPSTDRPPVEDFIDSKPLDLCSYRDCDSSSTALADIRVTTGTDATVNRTLILVDTQQHRLCQHHAAWAQSGRWPMQGWKFWVTLAGTLVLCGVMSLALLGLGVYLSLKRSNIQPRPAVA